jgi:vitamin B12 transporter
MSNSTLKKTGDIVYFKKWSRKGFGVFQTQGKQIAISTMIMACSITFETKTLFAQTDSVQQNPVMHLDEVIINGEEEPILFSKMARIVTVLNQKEIESAPVSDINELLEYAIGMEIRQRGQKGVQADLAMRGGNFDQTLVLLNGVNITDPQTGHHNLNLPIDLQSISRIEILSGPASRTYGINAYNGAINIITTSDVDSEIKLLGTAGQFGNMQQHASIRIGEKWNHFISAGHKQSDGYLPNNKLNNTDFSSSTLFYQGKIESNSHNLNLQTGYNTKEFGANSFYTPAYPEQFEATRTLFSSIDYRYKTSILKTGITAYYRKHHDRFELFRDTVPSWYKNHNYHMTDVVGGSLPLLIETNFGNFSTIASIRHTHIYSNVLGNLMSETVNVPGENAVFTHKDEQLHTSVQANYSIDFRKLHFAAGLMTSYYNTIDQLKTYPGLHLSYNLIKKLTVFASYNEALRLPTFTDLYYDGPTNIGNPHLKPEESQTLESGLKYVSSILRIQMAAYYRKGKNTIEWVKPLNAADDIQWQTQNLTQLNTKGIDFDLVVNFDNQLENKFIQKIAINYSWIDQDIASSQYETKYAGDYLKQQLAIRITHNIYKKLYANWGVLVQDRNGTYIEYKNGSFGNEVAYEITPLVNLKLSWQENNWTLFAEGTNLFDQTYFDISNVPQPGLWIQAGALFKLRNL